MRFTDDGSIVMTLNHVHTYKKGGVLTSATVVLNDEDDRAECVAFLRRYLVPKHEGALKDAGKAFSWNDTEERIIHSDRPEEKRVTYELTTPGPAQMRGRQPILDKVN